MEMLKKTLEYAINTSKEQFKKYEEETINGNYLQAREIVLQLKTDLTAIDSVFRTNSKSVS